MPTQLCNQLHPVALTTTKREVAMKFANPSLAVSLAILAAACADNSGYGPYYGPSQGYAYPSGRGYYAPPPN
jgi:hypothetical protein